MEHNELIRRYPVTVGVGTNMAERILYFDRVEKLEMIQPIVAQLLARDFSFRDISEVRIAEEGSSHSGKSFMVIETTDPSDWTSPAVLNGEQLEGRTIKNKTDLAVDAARFALLAAHSSKELLG